MYYVHRYDILLGKYLFIYFKKGILLIHFFPLYCVVYIKRSMTEHNQSHQLCNAFCDFSALRTASCRGRGLMQHSFSLIGRQGPATNPSSFSRARFLCAPGRGQLTLVVMVVMLVGFVGICA